MKTNNCNHCKCKQTCIKPCRIVTAELNRIEYGRKKKHVLLVFEANMERIELINFRNITAGEYHGPDDNE
jgi:hypothetical protein